MIYEKQMEESWNNWGSGIEYTPRMNPSLERGFKAGLQAMQDDVVEWSKSTFPKATKQAFVDKLREEIAELEYELLLPGNDEKTIEEAADVVIVICSLLDRMGKKMHEVVHAKMEINRARKWGAEDSQGDRPRDKT